MSPAFQAFSDVQERIVDAISAPKAMWKDFFERGIISEDFGGRKNLGNLEVRRTLVEAVADDIRRQPRHIQTVIAVMRCYRATKALADEIENGMCVSVA